MSAERNPHLADVEAAFLAVSTDGERHTIGSVPAIWTTGHVQGLARHGHDWIASVSAPTLNHGLLCVMDADANQFRASHATPSDELDHPGGMQVCGDYLVVATQKYPSSDRHGKVLIYDLARADAWSAPVNQIALDQFPAGAVACTDVNDASVPSGYRHIIAANDNGRLWFWRSDGRPLAQATFTPCAITTNIVGGATEQVTLLTGAHGELYLVSTEGHWEGLAWADKATLWRVELDGANAPHVSRVGNTRHFKTHHGSIIGAAGVHMRYGGGARAASSTKLELFATQMHLIGGSGFALNVFTGTTPPLRLERFRDRDRIV